MKRKVVTLTQVIMAFEGYESIAEMNKYMTTEERDHGILYWTEVENMGFCRDGVTRFYMFDMPDGTPAIYFKH